MRLTIGSAFVSRFGSLKSKNRPRPSCFRSVCVRLELHYSRNAISVSGFSPGRLRQEVRDGGGVEGPGERRHRQRDVLRQRVVDERLQRGRGAGHGVVTKYITIRAYPYP